MVSTRAPCQRCSLPFYTDENDRCPYCGEVTPDGSTGGSSARPRTTCGTCGLPYYEDEQENCPYCAQAWHAAEASMPNITEVEQGNAVEGPERRPRPDASVAGSATVDDDTGTGPASTRSRPTADDRTEEERSSSLVGSLLRPVRKLFGG